MKETTVVRIGQWAAILTLVFGGALATHYIVNRETESGTLAYFFLVFAGIIDSIIFIPLLIFGIISKQNSRQLLLTAFILLVAYVILAVITYYMFRLG